MTVSETQFPRSDDIGSGLAHELRVHVLRRCADEADHTVLQYLPGSQRDRHVRVADRMRELLHAELGDADIF